MSTAAARDARTANLLGAFALAVTDAMTAAVAAAADRGGSGPAALVLIHDEPGGSVETLRGGLGLSQPGAARLVDTLVADGLVERRPGPDGRTWALHLTSGGAARARRLLRARADVLADVLAPLSATDRRALTPILEGALGALVQDEPHAVMICRLCEERACPLDACPVEHAPHAASRR